MHFTTAAVATMVGAAAAKTIKIDAGEGGLVFKPANSKAEMGDTLEFHFYPRKHSVVRGDPDKACSPMMDGGFYSGFIPSSKGEAPMVFTVMVNTTDPMFFYCSEDMHCQDGMVGAVNADDDALEKYMTDAGEAKDNVSPDSVFGGVVGKASGGDGDMSMSMSSGMMSSSMMSSGMMSSSMMSSDDMEDMSSTMMMSGGGGGGVDTTMGMTKSGGMGGGASMTSDGMPAQTSTKDDAAAGVRGSIAAALAGAVGVAALLL